MDPMLKQRMVGTAVLVGLAVIFVPMVLDGPVDRPDAPQSVGVPLALPEADETVPADDGEPIAAPTESVDEPEATAQAPAPAAGYAIQLGSFSDAENAAALAAEVGRAGFVAFVQRVQVENGTMYRVRVGPVPDRAEADALAARVGRETGERGVVVPHP